MDNHSLRSKVTLLHEYLLKKTSLHSPMCYNEDVSNENICLWLMFLTGFTWQRGLTTFLTCVWAHKAYLLTASIRFVSSHFYQSKLLKNIVPQRYLLIHHVYYFQAPVFKLFDLLFCFYYFPCWFSVFNNTNYS